MSATSDAADTRLKSGPLISGAKDVETRILETGPSQKFQGVRGGLRLLGGPSGAQQDQDIVRLPLYAPILSCRRESGLRLAVDIEEEPRLLTAMHGLSPTFFDREGGGQLAIGE